MSRFVDEFQPAPTDVALCGSMAHKQLWLPIIDELRAMGLSVSTPDLTEAVVDWSKLGGADIMKRKGRLIRRHTANIETARCVLVANFAKNSIDNYIGANTFLEMVVAFTFEKPIYLYNPVPKQDNFEEILALEPIMINGDISKIEVNNRSI